MLDFETLERETLRIANKKISHVSHEATIQAPRMGTGGDFDGIFLWDTAFTCMWAKYFADRLPVHTSLDNLYRLQDADGFIHRQYTAEGEPVFPKFHPSSFAPPILAWAEWDLYGLSGDRERIATVFPHLRDFHRYCRATFRMPDGLYMGDHLGCGMDNLPRWPRDFDGHGEHIELTPEQIHSTSAQEWYRGDVYGSLASKWNLQGRFIDMSAQMALDARILAQMAELLGLQEACAEFKDEHVELARTINATCWSDEHEFYFDIGFGEQIKRFHIGAYWCLLAGVVPPPRIDALCRHLTDLTKFGRPVPVPTLAASDPDYVSGGQYWLGSSWAPTTYMVLKGLQQTDRLNLAQELAVVYVQAVSSVLQTSGTIWENMCPERAEPGSWSAPDFCGWSGLASVAIPRECLAIAR